MNLDDLMVVWKSQDAAPLHDVNKTLLHLALRQEQLTLQKARRLERWIIYVASVGFVAAMALFLGVMIATRERNVMVGWDFVMPIVGAAAALFAGVAMYLNHKGQARRDQGFGESLRDQLHRSIAQLDDRALRARLTLVMVLLAGICPIVILLLGLRINQKSFSDNGFLIVSMIVVSFWGVAAGVWELRRQSRDVLPRKHRLEALLKELDAP